MKHFTVTIEDKEKEFFLELMDSLSFVKKVEEKTTTDTGSTDFKDTGDKNPDDYSVSGR